MTWFDSLRGLTGDRSDPIEEMKNYANEQQRQNRAAIGMDANGNPLPADAAAGQQATVAAHAASTLPPGQEPNATKTPPSLGATIMDLARYEQREQGFNQAMGGAFASVSQPRNRDWVKGIFNVNPIDAAKYGQTMMNVGSQQQGQDRSNMVNRLVNDPDVGPKIAQAYGMDWAGLKAGVLADPGLVARIAETWGTADPKVRAGTQVGHGALGGGAPGAPGGAGPLSDIGTQIVAGVPGEENAAMNLKQAAWDKKHPGQPTPWARNDLADFKLYTDKQAELQTSAADFGRDRHSQSIDRVTEFQHRVEALKTDPGMQKILDNSNAYKQAMIWMMAHKGDTAEQLANAAPEWAAVIAQYPPEVKRALAEIQLLRSQDYATAMHSIGTRFSTQEVQNVSKGMDNLLNLELSKDDYNEGLDRLADETKTIRANSHGAAQDFDTMEPDLRTYVNPTFTKGGRRNVEGSGSEDWADKVKPPPEEIEKAKAAIARGVARPEVERLMRKRGFRPTGF